MQLLVVLPVYNEENNPKILIPKILTLNDYLKIGIIDDCSLDKSVEIIKGLKEKNPDRIFIISQHKHLGRGSVIKEGYKFAIYNNFEFLIEMDSDFAHRPEDLSFLLKETNGVDMVIGSRLIKGSYIRGRFFLRNFITYFANIYLRFILGLKEIHDLTSGFRCINVDFLRRIDPRLLKSNGPQFLQEIIFKNKDRIRIKEVPIIFENRYLGRSKFSLFIILKSLWLPLFWRIENLWKNIKLLSLLK